MSLIFNGTNIENIIVIDSKTGNQTSLDKLIVNDTVVWESEERYVFSVIGGNLYDLTSEGDFKFVIDCTNTKGAKASIDNQVFIIEPGMKKTIELTLSSGPKELIIEGFVDSFKFLTETLSASNTTRVLYGTLVDIIEWRGIKFIPDEFLSGRFENYVSSPYRTIHIPGVIKELNSECLSRDFIELEFENSKNIERISYDAFSENVPSPGYKPFENVEISEDGIYYIIDDILLGLVNRGNITIANIPNEIRIMSDGSSGTCGLFSSMTTLTEINFNNDGKLKKIPQYFLHGCTGLTEIIIPSSVESIGDVAFGNTMGEMKLTKVTFNQPEEMNIKLPPSGIMSNGTDTGMFKVKTSRNMNIYTNNKIIAFYDYWDDNITPIIYKLDGTLWEKVNTPTVSITGNVLSISGTDATSFEITKSGLPEVTKTITTNSVNLVELFGITDFTTELTISVVGFKDNAVRSDKVNIIYTPMEE